MVFLAEKVEGEDMRNIIAACFLMILSAAHGRVLTCRISPTDYGPSTVTWDDVALTAKIFNPIYGTLPGRVSKLPFDQSSGKVVNLSFTSIPPVWKQSEWEFVVQRATSGFVIEGVAYVTVKGVRYLDNILITRDADCDFK